MANMERAPAARGSGRTLGLVAALVVGAALGQAGIAAPAPLDEARPSFRCGAGLNPVERMICGDAELRAYDRAMALAYAARGGRAPSAADQRVWLTKRNGCTDRDCVFSAYRDWFGNFEGWGQLGRPLKRRGAPPDGSDLMLASLQSPSNRVDSKGHSASLSIRHVGGGWHLFRADAAYTYDPHDGRGSNLSTSEAHGVVRIAAGKGSYAASEDRCAVAFTRVARGGWRLAENGSCSGLGSSLSGIYR